LRAQCVLIAEYLAQSAGRRAKRQAEEISEIDHDIQILQDRKQRLTDEKHQSELIAGLGTMNTICVCLDSELSDENK